MTGFRFTTATFQSNVHSGISNPINTAGLIVDGTSGNDILYGSNGADSLYGYEGRDYLSAGRGNDLLDGGADNDVLEGGAGSDTLIGGEGRDTASYRNASVGVMVDLTMGGITNDVAGDTFSSIEDVWGSAHGDIINGDGNANASSAITATTTCSARAATTSFSAAPATISSAAAKAATCYPVASATTG